VTLGLDPSSQSFLHRNHHKHHRNHVHNHNNNNHHDSNSSTPVTPVKSEYNVPSPPTTPNNFNHNKVSQTKKNLLCCTCIRRRNTCRCGVFLTGLLIKIFCIIFCLLSFIVFIKKNYRTLRAPISIFLFYILIKYIKLF
jgi:hypothetical protein